MPYVLTGKAATLVAARIPFAAATQSCAVTGAAAGLKVGYKIASATDAFAVSGTAAVNWASRTLVAATVAVAIAGTAIELTHILARMIAADAGTFDVSGIVVVQAAGRRIQAERAGGCALTLV